MASRTHIVPIFVGSSVRLLGSREPQAVVLLPRFLSGAYCIVQNASNRLAASVPGSGLFLWATRSK